MKKHTSWNRSRISFSSAVGGKLVTKRVDPPPICTSIVRPSRGFWSLVRAVAASSLLSNSITAETDSICDGNSFKLLIVPH